MRRLQLLCKSMMSVAVFLISQNVLAFQFNMAQWGSCKMTRSSCSDHYNAGCRADGQYSIRVGGQLKTAFCDMSSDGGGWTRLNSTLVSSITNTWGSDDVINGTNLGQLCGGTGSSLTVNSVLMSYSNVKMIFTRSTTTQCPRLPGLSETQAFYWDTATASWMTGHYCSWNTPWASSSLYPAITNLPTKWKGIYSGSATTFSFVSVCSDSRDNGAYTIQFFVK